MKRMIFGVLVAGFAAILLVIAAQAQSDKCRQGFVWREAFAGDHVCVTPATRTQAAEDNRLASTRIDPAGAYGPNTCISGYVWREASPGDLVCVTPETREQTKYDNSQAKNRLATDEYKYTRPLWNDRRLDWCYKWGADCGKRAADNFCMRRRWTGASAFEADPNIGASSPTIVMSTNQVCDQSNCTGFTYITCYGKIPANRVFANPKIPAQLEDGSIREFRLDECYNWDTGCGRQAANAFCTEEGFVRSFYYVRDASPSSVDTLTIGTYEVCDVNGYDCYGFQMIICQ